MLTQDLQYSQREFSKVTGISTVTVSKLIKEGKIKLDPVTKMIPKQEVNKIILLRAKRVRYKSILVLCVGHEDKCEETAENLTNHFIEERDSDDVPFYFNNENGQVKFDLDFSDPTFIEKLIPEEYNKRVFKKFIELYKGCVDSTFLNAVTKHVITNKEFGNEAIKSGVDFYRDLLCGQDNCIIASNKKNNKEDDKIITLDDKFNSIMHNLQLLDKDGNLLFERVDLTPEFFEGNGELYHKYVKDKKSNEDVIIERLPKQNNSILIEARDYIRNKIFKESVDAQLGSGFFTTLFIDLNNPDTCLDDLISLLSSELFSTIMFNIDEKYYDEAVPPVLKSILNSYINNGYNVKFAK